MEQNTKMGAPNNGMPQFPKRRLKNCKQMFKIMEKDCDMDKDDIMVLEENINFTYDELVGKSHKGGNMDPSLLTPEFRSFALTLEYYSPKAYHFLRKYYKINLPDPMLFRKLYINDKGEPGFHKEVLEALKAKSELNNGIIASLTINGRPLDNREDHFFDIGTGYEGDCIPDVRCVIVFFITAININFKAPVGYFLVDGMNGPRRANLIRKCIENLHEIGVTVASLTIDPMINYCIDMIELLGCSIETGNEKFKHPVTKEPIVAIFDPYRVMKHLRLCMQMHKLFINKNDEEIHWFYVKKLRKQFKPRKCKVSDKLMQHYCKFYEERVDIHLSKNPFSHKIAEAIKYCRVTLKHPNYKNSKATENFITLIANIFDILTSKNILETGFKKPICKENAAEIIKYLDFAFDYILNMKTEDETPLRKVTVPRSRQVIQQSLLGLLGCIKSLKHLFVTYIETNAMKHLPAYTLCIDHSDLFLYSVIGNVEEKPNDLTADEFKNSYKKILKSGKDKDKIEKLSFLKCSSEIKRLNKTTGMDYFDEDFLRVTVVMMNDDDRKVKPDDRHEKNFLNVVKILKTYDQESITHFASFIVRLLISKLHCDVCVSSLISTECNSLYKSVVGNNKGKILYPSSDVIKICTTAEQILKRYKGLVYNKDRLIAITMRQFVGTKLFDNISYHQYGQFPTSNHVTYLIKAIAKLYITKRMIVTTSQTCPTVSELMEGFRRRFLFDCFLEAMFS